MVRRALSPISLDGCEELPSIIDLMLPICGARSTEPLSLQRTDIQNQMMREFERQMRNADHIQE